MTSTKSIPLKPTRSILWLLIPIAFGFRLIYAASRQLVPDEAFYWALSRHLSTGYLDHPPMVAYLIRLGTLLCGSNELGVRFFAAGMAFGAMLLLLGMCRRIVADERAVVWLGLIWICSPLFAGLATIMTPDTPSIFFSVCALVMAVSIARRIENAAEGIGESGSILRNSGEGLRSGNLKSEISNSESQPPTSALPRSTGRGGKGGTPPLLGWLAFGLFTGLAMLSKYTAVLPAGAVVIAMMSTPSGRKEFARPGIWLAGIIALLVFSPVTYWNATHQWASFKFQLHHGLSADIPAGQSITMLTWLATHLGSLGEYLGGQLAMWTPVFFILGVIVVALRFYNYAALSLSHRILVWSATIPLLFFGFAAFKSGHAGEANWPAFGYFPMSVLVIGFVAETWAAERLKWIKIGIAVGLAIAIPLHAPEMLYSLGLKRGFPRKLNEMFGWREMGRSVGLYRGDALVIATTHQDAGELAFYLPGQPDVWVYPILDESGQPVSRPTAFDYFPDRPDLSRVSRVLLVGGHKDKFCKTYNFKTAGLTHWIIILHGRQRDREIAACERLATK